MMIWKNLEDFRRINDLRVNKRWIQMDEDGRMYLCFEIDSGKGD
jgi:hypothetical protein